MSEIRILGRVDPDLLELVDITNDELVDITNDDWYFVDYSPEEYKLGTWFQVIMDDEFEDNFAQLVECYPDARFKCDSIPKGYKTICRFEFTNQINGLSVLKTWKVTKKIVILRPINIAELRDKRINDILND
jgi:hypothetical protein